MQGRINSDEYQEKRKKMVRAWHTTAWKKKRKEVLKDKCVKCGSTERLTLQHSWHPSDHARRVSSEYRTKVIQPAIDKDMRENNEVFDPKKVKIVRTTKDRNVCPHCEKGGVWYRKAADNWKCGKCRAEFIEPKKITDWTHGSPEYQIQMAENNFKRSIHTKICAKYEPLVQNEWAKAHAYASIIYENLEEGVETYCRRCAFVEDKNRGLIQKHHNSTINGRSFYNPYKGRRM